MRKYSTLFLLFIAVLSLDACNTVQRAISKGDYDAAVQKSARKLKRDPDKTKYISLLERAYTKAFERDIKKVSYLRSEGDPSRKPEIYYTLLDIRARYESLQPLLPLKVGNHQAVFQNVSDGDLIAAKQDAADYLYSHALKLLETKDHANARKAYDELLQTQSMFSDFRDVGQKLGEARALGTKHVLVKVVNASSVSLPPGFEKQLLSLQVNDLNSDWVKYHNVATENHNYQYKVVARIGNIGVTPGEVEHFMYTESKQIEDGWEYMLDKNGNALKDSLGKNIKRIKYTTVSCRVSETRMRKRAGINGWVDYNAYNGTTYKSIPFGTEVIFEYVYASALGDVRALSQQTLNKVNAMPGVFPNDGQMLNDAALKLKPIIYQVLNDNRNMIL